MRPACRGRRRFARLHRLRAFSPGFPESLPQLAPWPAGRFASPHPLLAPIREALNLVRLDDRDRPGDGRFVGGWAGYLGYEFGSALEGVPPATAGDMALPRMRWAFYDAVACFEHTTGRWELSALMLDDEPAARGDVLDEWLRRSAGSQPGVAVPHSQARAVVADPHPDPRPDSEKGTGPHRRGGDARLDCVGGLQLYARRLRAGGRAGQGHIAAGDIYQVNLSQRFSSPIGASPAAPGQLFARLSRRHPAWYTCVPAVAGSWAPLAARAREDAGSATRVQAVCSASPELFLSLSGRRVVTRPIKGTRPRTADPEADRAARRRTAWPAPRTRPSWR